jgi:hypothetical protein
MFGGKRILYLINFNKIKIFRTGKRTNKPIVCAMERKILMALEIKRKPSQLIVRVKTAAY